MKKAIKIGAWNVRGRNQQGKLQISVEQMARQGISILGMAETFWKGDTSFRMRAARNEEGYTVIMRGGKNSRKGVGFITQNKEIEEMI